MVFTSTITATDAWKITTSSTTYIVAFKFERGVILSFVAIKSGVVRMVVFLSTTEDSVYWSKMKFLITLWPAFGSRLTPILL